MSNRYNPWNWHNLPHPGTVSYLTLQKCDAKSDCTKILLIFNLFLNQLRDFLTLRRQEVAYPQVDWKLVTDDFFVVLCWFQSFADGNLVISCLQFNWNLVISCLLPIWSLDSWLTVFLHNTWWFEICPDDLKPGQLVDGDQTNLKHTWSPFSQLSSHSCSIFAFFILSYI